MIKDKQEKKKRKIVLAKEILLKILGSAMELNEIVSDLRRYQKASAVGGREYVKFIKRLENERGIRQEVARLKRAKLIEERKISGCLRFCLTEKGKKSALRHQIIKCQNNLKDKYYVVIFDIPETERKIRSLFRLFLKEANFIRLQQSVWVTQKDIKEQLLELIKSANAEKWIKIITAIDITNFNDTADLKRK